ncbi:hypothetical protein [Pseudomonas weihenstephanensis]|uniref:hypothetical protein n=1 Tax=Pseudomonas weihenstephanensis TaxID=1608994 RepID=UPI00069D1DB6|nr:hypothetical protein [Pseudomonas weihenstephanensis]
MRNIETREGYDLWDKAHELPRFNFWRGGEDEKGSVIRVPEKHGNWINFNDLTTLADQYQDEINSLRERLARLELKSVKPCSPVAQHQGEPVAKAKPVAKLHAERLTGRDGEYGVTVEDSEWSNTCRLTGGIFNLYAEQSEPVAEVPEGYCIMPKRLTAENGAKALLLGEFQLEVTTECPECRDLEEPLEGCEFCDGEGEYGQKHTIPWDQIKFIYSEAVRGLARPNVVKS